MWTTILADISAVLPFAITAVVLADKVVDALPGAAKGTTLYKVKALLDVVAINWGKGASK